MGQKVCLKRKILQTTSISVSGIITHGGGQNFRKMATKIVRFQREFFNKS